MQKGYEWLLKEQAPNMLLQMLAIYGVKETPGAGDNPIIMAWADETGLRNVYKHDSVAWCGLACAVAAKRSSWDYAPKGNALWALNWASWGNAAPSPMLGDVMTFNRDGGGHVALYVGEDDTHYHILGGNQSDQVNIVRKAKSSFYKARRAPWRIAQPANVRKIILSSSGAPVSGKET